MIHLQVRAEDGHLVLPRRLYSAITWKNAVCVWEHKTEVDVRTKGRNEEGIKKTT